MFGRGFSFLLSTTFLGLGLAAACGGSSTELPLDSSDPSNDGTSSSSSNGGPGTSSSGGSSSSSSSSGDAAAPGDGGIDPSVIATATCSTPVPNGAKAAPALPTYAGQCPTLEGAGTYTTITSSGAARRFLVYRPAEIQQGETLPIVFLWHWLGGSPESMVNVTDLPTVVEARRIIAVVPDPKGDALFRWPFETTQSDARIDEELRFFDDMLACVGAALPVNKECVSSMGVSAGALWTAQLASRRSDRLASFVSLSGGTGGLIKPWVPAAHRMPGLVLWGGTDDVYPSKQAPLMNFETASKNLAGALAQDGHFLVECIHNCGHDVPPLDPPPPGTPGFDLVWRWVLDHPFWLPAGQSPLAGKPLPTPAFPAWCSIGLGTAVPRSAGACD